MCRESLTRENCFGACGRKGFNERQLNNWGCYAARPCPTDTESLTWTGAAADAHPRGTNTHDPLIKDINDGRSFCNWPSARVSRQKDFWWHVEFLTEAWKVKLMLKTDRNRNILNEKWALSFPHVHRPNQRAKILQNCYESSPGDIANKKTTFLSLELWIGRCKQICISEPCRARLMVLFAHLHVVFEGCIILVGNCVTKKQRASFLFYLSQLV